MVVENQHFVMEADEVFPGVIAEVQFMFFQAFHVRADGGCVISYRFQLVGRPHVAIGHVGLFLACFAGLHEGNSEGRDLMLHNIRLLLDFLHFLVKAIPALKIAVKQTSHVTKSLVNSGMHAYQFLQHHRGSHGDRHAARRADVFERPLFYSTRLRNDADDKTLQLFEKGQHRQGGGHVEHGMG